MNVNNIRRNCFMTVMRIGGLLLIIGLLYLDTQARIST